MSKTPVTAAELESLLLEEVRKQRECEGAASVSVHRLTDGGESNWIVQKFDTGSADRETCARAVIEVERKFRPLYELSAWP